MNFARDFLALTLAGATPTETTFTSPRGDVFLWIAEGVMRIFPSQSRDLSSTSSTRIVISAGVHGNETAPIEMLDRIVKKLTTGEIYTNSPLLLILGNPESMRINKRFQTFDLNRLFSNTHGRSDLPEVPRSIFLMTQVSDFFSSSPSLSFKFHLDLHTAIRDSKIEQFALSPVVLSKISSQVLYFLQASKISALVLQSIPSASTFAAFSNRQCGAESLTLELGKARPFGQNQNVNVSSLERALESLFMKGFEKKHEDLNLTFFETKQAIIRGQGDFKLQFSDDVENFTELPIGSVVATGVQSASTDSSLSNKLLVEYSGTRILFPNQSVAPGLRAGLLLVPVTQETAL